MPRLRYALPAVLLAICGCGQNAMHTAETGRPNAAPGLRAADGSNNIVPGRYIVVYVGGTTPSSASPAAGVQVVATLPSLSLNVVQTTSANDAATLALLAVQPGVQYVLHDRYVEGHSLTVSPHQEVISGPQSGAPTQPLNPPGVDAFYASPQGWAVRAAGGFGANAPAGPAVGPWDTTMGRGVRIAILDSGVDAAHPDIAPNLALNLSEVDTTALPSTCDDGSPQDQQGHGTWTASLAAGAAGPNTGGVIGVAPQATLLNIKVLERVPAATGANLIAQCESGQPAGLLSWVLQGIDDALANHADIISLSLGSIVDLDSGDGAGWKAAFDSVTHAAVSSGAVLIAAAGNDGLDLSGTSANPARYIELPAQARDVLTVVASTNPDCAENPSANAACVSGPVTRASYSNFGTTLNAIAAPGGNTPNASDTGISGYIRGACSTGEPGTAEGPPDATHSFGCFDSGHSAYVQAIGTSASAALTAGAAALLRAAHPAWTAAQIVAALRSTATPTPAMAEPLLNTPAALALP